MARPTKFNEPLARARSFRLRKSEDEKLQELLKDTGLELSEFFRNLLQDKEIVVVDRPKRVMSNQIRQEMLRSIGQIQKVGNNVNQLAHRANTDYLTGTLSEKTYQDILAELENVSLYLKEYLPRWE